MKTRGWTSCEIDFDWRWSSGYYPYTFISTDRSYRMRQTTHLLLLTSTDVYTLSVRL